MTVESLGRGLLKALLVILGTVAGAGSGFLLGGVFVETAMPNAGLEALGPPIVGTFLGAVLGSLVLLLVLFRLPRMRRQSAANVGGAAVLLLVLAAIGGLLATVATSTSSLLPLAAATCAFLAVFLGLCLGASVWFGRQPESQ